MAVRVTPGFKDQLTQHVLTELAANKAREEQNADQYTVDICTWAERHFYIPLTGKPVKLPLHQKAILRLFFTRDHTGHFPYQNLVYSTVKKSGKSTTAGIVARYFAETQARYGEVLTIGNDLEQAKDRSFKEVVRSLEMTPGYNKSKEMLPGKWYVNKLSIRCSMTGATIKAIAVDAKGEAGGQPALTIWTELWGFEETEARRFWDEMTPIPTVPDSLRLVETYAGYDGESDLLRSLYDRGMEGHQWTAGELAEKVCKNDVPGENYQDFVDCWTESRGNPDVKIPIWTNGRFAMYWDSGYIARRMPWQHNFLPLEEQGAICSDKCAVCLMPKGDHDIGIPANEYYAEQEEIGPPQAYRRLHFNEWVGAESQFVPMEAFDACSHEHTIPLIRDGSKTMAVIGVDAAVSGDCFGVVLVNRCSVDRDSVDIRALKKWDPRDKGGQIDLIEAENFLRQVCKAYNIVQIAFDPYQMESTAMRLRADGITWISPFIQAGDRLRADSQLYDLIIGKKLHYTHRQETTDEEACPEGANCNCWVAPLREHITNCNAKVQKDEDSKLRIVKKASGRKIDLAVALSMAAARCLYLRLEQPRAEIA